MPDLARCGEVGRLWLVPHDPPIPLRESIARRWVVVQRTGAALDLATRDAFELGFDGGGRWACHASVAPVSPDAAELAGATFREGRRVSESELVELVEERVVREGSLVREVLRRYADGTRVLSRELPADGNRPALRRSDTGTIHAVPYDERDAIDLSVYPVLRPVSVGTGRLRPLRWVDEAGSAWPFYRFSNLERNFLRRGHYALFVDMRLGVECMWWDTVEGGRCLPRGTVTLDARASGFDASGPAAAAYADPGCTERLVARYAGITPTHLAVVEDPDAICPVPHLVTELRRLDTPLTEGAPIYSRSIPDGACFLHSRVRAGSPLLFRQEDSAPEPLSRYARLDGRSP